MCKNDLQQRSQNQDSAHTIVVDIEINKLKFACIVFSSQQQKRRKALCIQTDLFLSFPITQPSFPINPLVWLWYDMTLYDFDFRLLLGATDHVSKCKPMKHTIPVFRQLPLLFGQLKKRSVCMQSAFLLFWCCDEKSMHANLNTSSDWKSMSTVVPGFKALGP